MIDDGQLAVWVAEAAERLSVPGVAAAIHHEDVASYACHGVTHVAHPLAVDTDTLFQIASVSKTHTATAVLVLVDRGLLELDAPVRTYLPELRLADEQAARDVTVRHLLNHTAGWQGDATPGSEGDGDDALSRYVTAMASAPQLTPVGTAYAYNNSAFTLAGRIVEKVTGTTFETAMNDLVLEPLGLDSSFYFLNDVMTRKFSVGHIQKADGTIVVARPWASPRAGNAAGGITCTVGDLLTWARFHLGDGTADDGKRILSPELLRAMQQPTFVKPLGDAVGLGWMLREIEGVGIASHGGSGIGQFSEVCLVPERGFAVACVANCGPNGQQLIRELVSWALHEHLGLDEPEPVPLDLGPDELASFSGEYDGGALLGHITVEPDGLLLRVNVKPEVLAEAGEEDPAYPPMHLALLPGDGDQYLITDGPFEKLRGFFVRGEDGAVDGIDLGGRPLTRVR